MPEDIFKVMGGKIAGAAQDEAVSAIADLVGDTAIQELERRHPDHIVEASKSDALTRAITSDELDAQIPAGFIERDPSLQ